MDVFAWLIVALCVVGIARRISHMAHYNRRDW